MFCQAPTSCPPVAVGQAETTCCGGICIAPALASVPALETAPAPAEVEPPVAGAAALLPEPPDPHDTTTARAGSTTPSATRTSFITSPCAGLDPSERDDASPFDAS